MAIILEGTPYEYALDGAFDVKLLYFAEKHPKSILVQISGKNPGFSVGDTITYNNGEINFTGKVWYIYNGSSSFNLYIKHPAPAQLHLKKGGVVTIGEAIKAVPTGEFESASTILKAEQEQDSIETPNGTVITPQRGAGEGIGDGEISGPSISDGAKGLLASLPPALQDPKKLLIGGAVLVIVGIVVIKKISK